MKTNISLAKDDEAIGRTKSKDMMAFDDDSEYNDLDN